MSDSLMDDSDIYTIYKDEYIQKVKRTEDLVERIQFPCLISLSAIKSYKYFFFGGGVDLIVIPYLPVKNGIYYGCKWWPSFQLTFGCRVFGRKNPSRPFL